VDRGAPHPGAVLYLGPAPIPAALKAAIESAAPAVGLVQATALDDAAAAAAVADTTPLLLVADPLTHALEMEALRRGVQECLDLAEVDAMSLHRALERAGARAGARTGAAAGSAATESEQQFRALAENVPVLVWMDDADHNLIYQNPVADAFSGRTIDQESGRGWFEGIHPDDVGPLDELYRDTVAKPGFYQRMLRLRRADGVYRWMLEIGVPRLAPDGALLGFLGVDVDVTELKEASARLEQAESRYRHFIEQSTEGIWRFELDAPMPVTLPESEQVRLLLDGSYLAECNVAMAAMYGYDRPEEMVGKYLRDLAAPDIPAMEDVLRRFIRSGYRLTNVETHERDRHGHSKLFLNNLVGVIENGAMVRSWGMQQDITERRVLEEETRQVRKMETAGRLAGGIAHDFNNLLTAILGTTEILLSELPAGATARTDVEEIKRAAGRAANLTRQLLAFGRRQVLKPRVLDLNQLVQGVETMLRRVIGEHITLVTKTDPALWRVRADPGQVEQVLLNLCVNARDAMPTGGTLTVETANIAFGGATHGPETIMPPGRYVLISVSDSGVGMEPDTLNHVFEPFFTTKEQGKGTGLGLATVYGIVKQSGGFIYADSKLGEGSRFRIYLPRVAETLDLPDPGGSEAAPARAEGTLLLVEDEEAVRRLTKRMLESVGYQVLEAARGSEALALAESWTGKIDLVVTDVIMPGMSGQELSTRLRAARPWLKILYISGYTDDAILQHGTLLPNTSFLHKPFTQHELARRVREIIGH
jgi:PAS domain S-box-containing protein